LQAATHRISKWLSPRRWVEIPKLKRSMWYILPNLDEEVAVPNRRPSSYQTLPIKAWREIRRRYEAGAPTSSLCRAYGVPASTFHNRRRREGWLRELPSPQGDADAAAVGWSILPGATDQAGVAIEGNSTLMARATEKVRTLPNQQASTLPPSGRPPDVHLGANSALEVNASHLRLAANLRRRVLELIEENDLGAAPGRQSRALTDLATAIERLQRVERKALEMDERGADQRPNVIIVVPTKLSEEEWLRAAQVDIPVVTIGGGDPGARQADGRRR
jgi:hypothetical protein